MARIPPVDETAADEATKRALSQVRDAWGTSWNMTAGMANNPAVLKAFFEFNRRLDSCGLTATDREVVCMEMARASGCHYCVPAHRYVARKKGVDAAMIEAVARGETLECAATALGSRQDRDIHTVVLAQTPS